MKLNPLNPLNRLLAKGFLDSHSLYGSLSAGLLLLVTSQLHMFRAIFVINPERHIFSILFSFFLQFLLFYIGGKIFFWSLAELIIAIKTYTPPTDDEISTEEAAQDKLEEAPQK